MFDAVINALSALAQWLDSVFVAIFTALWQISEDLFIDSLDLLLQGVTAVLNTLPAPTFLSGVSLQAAFSSLGGDILFFFRRLQHRTGHRPAGWCLRVSYGAQGRDAFPMVMPC